MKFTKLTSAAFVGASVLSMLAPVATHAATQEGNKDANGGVELPQTDKTTAGISFGDNKPNANTGYLRLQMVPHVLDFGNHTQFFSDYPVFTADGKNYGKDDNNRHMNYKDDDTNQTALLNTEDAKLSKVSGDAWATVVDKQVTRSNADAKNTAKSGTWELNVAADGPLQAKDTAGNVIAGEDITDANLSFARTAYGRTDDVFTLTGEDQDADFATQHAASTTTNDDKDIATSEITPSFSMDLTAPTTGTDATQHLVATAKDGEGEGADVFGWKTSDVKLTMPKTSEVKNAVYESNLTWTLSTGVK